MLVKEPGDFFGTDVPTSLEEATSQDADGIAVGLDQVGHDLGKLDLLFQTRDRVAGKGKEGGEGVHVVGMDLGDMGIGNYNVGQTAEGLNTVGEARREDTEGEVGRREELLG